MGCVSNYRGVRVNLRSILKSALAISTALLLSACIALSEHLEEASSHGLYRETPSELLNRTATQTDGSSENLSDISGLYISEITSDHRWYFTPAHRNLLLRVMQKGSDVTAYDSTYQVKMEGRLNSNTIQFYVYPSKPTSGNAISGQWTIDPDGYSLTGSWGAASHAADGIWNLRKLDNDGVELYTTESGINNPFVIDEITRFFDMLFSLDEEKNIVIYLHGRGEDFEAEFDASGVPYVEDYSNTRFVIIRWLSWADVTFRPYNHAISTANGLAQFLYALDAYKSGSPENIGNRKITLLAHSMGNIAVEAFLKYLYQKGSLQSGLLDSLILNSADTSFDNHRLWLEKCDFSNKIFVTQHNRDFILHISNLFFSEEEEPGNLKLGIGLDAEDTSYNEQYSGKVKYLDLTNLTFTGHKHFSDTESRGLFKLLLNGREFDSIDPEAGLHRKSAHNPVYYFYKGKSEQAEHFPDNK